MQLHELKLEQQVEINGHDYLYKGIQKKHIENFGKLECFVFWCEKIKHEKLFVKSKKSKLELKVKDGKLRI